MNELKNSFLKKKNGHKKKKKKVQKETKFETMTFEPSKFSNTTFGAPARRNQHSLMQMSTKSTQSLQMAPIAKQPADQQLAAQFAQHQLANANHQNQHQIQSNSNVNANLNHSFSRFPMNLPTVVANNRHVFAHSNSSTSNTPKIQSPSSVTVILSLSLLALNFFFFFFFFFFSRNPLFLLHSLNFNVKFNNNNNQSTLNNLLLLTTTTATTTM
jgi:hypothetical protein